MRHDTASADVFLVEIFPHIFALLGHLLPKDNRLARQKLPLLAQLVIGEMHVHIHEQAVVTENGCDEVGEEALAHASASDGPERAVDVLPAEHEAERRKVAFEGQRVSE